jgi:ribonuclease BN (tRNA processing enzyme)
MRLTVLGKSPAWPDAGGACSGYLVEDAGTRVLLDCGPGVFAKLREVVDYRAVDAVVLSHGHADHVLDVVPYASGLRFGPHPEGRVPRPALHVPPGGAEGLAALADAASMGREHVALAFDVREYDPEATLAIGPLALRFRAVPHFVPTYAVDVSGPGGRLTYGADCGPNEGLCELAAQTPLLIAEATLPEPDPEGAGHLTARQAGEHGRRAGARRLMITHLTDELSEAAAREAAEAGFGGPVEVARGGASLVL